jgi:hypothetical protein
LKEKNIAESDEGSRAWQSKQGISAFITIITGYIIIQSSREICLRSQVSEWMEALSSRQ